MQHILKPGLATNTTRAGGKAAALAKMTQAGLAVPPWVVLEAQAATTGNMAELEKEVARATRHICRKTGSNWLAVRSSAAQEDSSTNSFAGQLESYLFVPPARVMDKIQAVWQSALSPQVISYCRQKGLPSLPSRPAVIIQSMIDADVAGVAFSRDPLSGQATTIVESVWGCGHALVSGQADPDRFCVSRQGQITQQEIAHKPVALRLCLSTQDGLQERTTAGDADQPSLNPDQVRQVAALARRAEELFGCPQDIEWAIAGNQLYILQSRPITTLVAATSLVIYDNSNIQESYNGVTTPLTFTFARRAYEHVYREFCRLVGVDVATIAAHQDIFPHMIELVNGRIYYNLLNWYRLLSLFPGYKLNAGFMEQMMGVKEPLPPHLVATGAAAKLSPLGKLKETWRAGSALAGLVLSWHKLPRTQQDFYERLATSLAVGPDELARMNIAELVALYRDLESKLLFAWDAPLVNDFFAMIFYGVLQALGKKWCQDEDGSLANSLVAARGDIVSAIPARRIQDLARLAALEPELVQLLTTTHITGPADLHAYPQFQAGVASYINDWGDRCLEELKLETPTWHDDASMLLRSIGLLAAKKRFIEICPDNKAGAGTQQAEKRVQDVLSAHPARYAILSWVIAKARYHMTSRENLRFERTRVFAMVRRIFLAAGDRLHKQGLLSEPRDIFYLELDEVLKLGEEAKSFSDPASDALLPLSPVRDKRTLAKHLKDMVHAAKVEFDHYKALPEPPNRVEAAGPLTVLAAAPAPSSAAASVDPARSNQLAGKGCCPGTVTGRVRVISDPRQAVQGKAVLEPGEILVARRTDPGWVVLFPAAAGLIVEQGSLLSHSAIVSRELGLPSIIGVTNATTRLSTGDLIAMNGAAGTITILGNASPTPADQAIPN